jgi:hypothetical protein
MRRLGFSALLLTVAVPAARAESFGEDLAFLRKHLEVVVLAAGDAKVVVAPAWQGRVVTSTAAGDSGTSFGWINRALAASGKLQPHINAFGGEDRIWLGPEGGQFSIFFRAGDPFDLEHWQTPAAIDSESWPVVGRSADRVRFSRSFKLTNRAGTTFDVKVDRTIRLISQQEIDATCGPRRPPGTRSNSRVVGYQSENRLTNVGARAWTRAGGLLSIWSMGMFAPSPSTTVVIPLSPAARGRKDVVNDAYFGRVPRDRLVVSGDAVFFRADGQQRGKIGIRPPYARSLLGSYDAGNRVLTVVSYNPPAGPRPYVNSLWQEQKDPFAGDVVNSYNDGPPAPGKKPLGPFYELETSSPGAELAPGASLDHTHRTIHYQADAGTLDHLAQACLGVSLATIQSAFSR